MFVFVTFAITKIRDRVKKRKHNCVKSQGIFLDGRLAVYWQQMIHFAQTSTDQVISQKAQLVRIITACVVVAMVVSQLFTYEAFVAIFRRAGEWNILVAASIVVLEVAALPYLLSMDLSKLARMTSKLASWLVAPAWGIILMTTSRGEPTGFFGTVVSLPSGFIAGGVAILLLVMMIISTMYKGRH